MTSHKGRGHEPKIVYGILSYIAEPLNDAAMEYARATWGLPDLGCYVLFLNDDLFAGNKVYGVPCDFNEITGMSSLSAPVQLGTQPFEKRAAVRGFCEALCKASLGEYEDDAPRYYLVIDGPWREYFASPKNMNNPWAEKP